VAAAGAAVVAGGSTEGTATLVAYAAVVGGALALASGLRDVRSSNDTRRRASPRRPRARELDELEGGASRKVEKRRRMDKSPPP
jgi:hypothetical protein